MTKTLKDALAKLAAAPPRAFARTRNALAAELREAGDTQGANELKRRRAPSVPVWVVNRLAVEAPDGVESLSTAASRLRAAQLGRGGTGTLAAEAARYRDATDQLLERARKILRDSQSAASRQILSRIQTTLSAAVADPRSRAALRESRLERELTARGFDVFAGAAPAATRPAAARSGPRARPGRAPAAPGGKERRPRTRDAADRRREERRREEAARAQQRRERIARAAAAVDEARRGAARADAAASAARARVSQLLDQLREVKRGLAERSADARQAHRRLRQAERSFTTVERGRNRAGSSEE